MRKSEIERIRTVYSQRSTDPAVKALWAKEDPRVKYLSDRRWADVRKLLAGHGLDSLADINVLDIGCGDGSNLERFVSLGARHDRLHGIDLMEDRITAARERQPLIDFRCGNAEDLPYPDGSFDLITQFTAFSSILDQNMKAGIAGEMNRVLKSGGLILWYDMRPRGFVGTLVEWLALLPTQPLKIGKEVAKHILQSAAKPSEIYIKEIDLDELKMLFPAFEVDARLQGVPLRLGGAGLGARLRAGVARLAGPVRTHYLAALKKTISAESTR